MPKIVILNDEGDILYQNMLRDVQNLLKSIHDTSTLPGYPSISSPVRIGGLIVLVEQAPKSKQINPKLSPRQCRVLQCMAQSLTLGQIATNMGVSKATIRLHISTLKKKFGTNSRDQLMARAGYLGLCDPFAGEAAFADTGSLNAEN